MVEFDEEWDQMPVAELHQLDALCDQFEQSIDRDPKTRVERFLIGVRPEQQRVLVRELVSLEIEKRKSRGESLTAEEYGSRFPALIRKPLRTTCTPNGVASGRRPQNQHVTSICRPTECWDIIECSL